MHTHTSTTPRVPSFLFVKRCHYCDQPIRRMLRRSSVVRYCSKRCSQAYRDLGRMRRAV